MHIVEFQYFRKSLQIQNADAMHDLYPIYLKVRRHVKAALKDYLVQGDNLNIYPNLPRMSDLEIISLAITAECLGIDSLPIPTCKLSREHSSTICRKETDEIKAPKAGAHLTSNTTLGSSSI